MTAPGLTRRAMVLGALAWSLPAAAAEPTIAQGLVEAANAARRAAGLPALHWNGRLARAASAHARAMLSTGEFSHSAGGTRLAGRVRRAGYRFARVSENIAWTSRHWSGGAEAASSLHAMWMNSPGHRRNILDRDVAELGVGIAMHGRQTYAVQVFGRPA